MSDSPPTPDAGAVDDEPALRTATIRDTGDERVYVEWYVNTPTPSFVSLLTGEQGDGNRVVALDSIEVPQAARALLAALEAESGSALIRDIDPIERVWLETEGKFVTLRTTEARGPGEMLVLDEQEARDLLSAVELAKKEIGDVEDEPYV